MQYNRKFFKAGLVKFVGKLEGKEDIYVGVEFDKPKFKNSGCYKVSSGEDPFDQLAAFLGDVTEDEYSIINWKNTKSSRVIDAVDASRMLSFYAKRSTRGASVTNQSIWQEINKTQTTES